jgi:hypothetical protein
LIAKVGAAFVAGVAVGVAGALFLGPYVSNAPSLRSAVVGPSFGELAMRQFLYDPDAAQFRNIKQPGDSPLTWCGEVNGKNRFGGRVGFQRFVVLADPRRPKSVEDATIFVDGDDANDGFEGRWGVYCLS